MGLKGMKWTVIFDDKNVTCQSVLNDEGSPTPYKVNDDAFWNDSKFSNIWAIQYGTSNTSDEVEHRDETPHCSYAEANLGDISQFTNKWDVVHLSVLQNNWDNDNLVDEEGNSTETEAEKIARLGPRPTSYSS